MVLWLYVGIYDSKAVLCDELLGMVFWPYYFFIILRFELKWYTPFNTNLCKTLISGSRRSTFLFSSCLLSWWVIRSILLVRIRNTQIGVNYNKIFTTYVDWGHREKKMEMNKLLWYLHLPSRISVIIYTEEYDGLEPHSYKFTEWCRELTSL